MDPLPWRLPPAGCGGVNEECVVAVDGEAVVGNDEDGPPPNVVRRCGTVERLRGETLVAGGPRAPKCKATGKTDVRERVYADVRGSIAWYGQTSFPREIIPPVACCI